MSPEDQRESERRAEKAVAALGILGTTPTDVQRDCLRRAYIIFLAGRRLDGGPAVKALQRELAKFARAVRAERHVYGLVLGLSDWACEALEAELAAQGYPPGYAHRGDPVVISAAARRLSNFLTAPSNRRLTHDLLDTLVMELAAIYQDVTGTPPGYTRRDGDDGLAAGAFVDFSIAVLKALQVEVGPSHVANVLSRVRPKMT